MNRAFINAVIAALQDLYYEGPGARALLVRLGYPAARIPAFHRADSFWTEVVMNLERGIIVDGIRAALTEAAADNPGNAELAPLLARLDGTSGAAPVRALALLSDPARDSKLRLDREARMLADAGVTVRHATRVSDIVTALRTTRPEILHFAGHGMHDGSLVFEDDAGERAEVRLERLAEAIAATVDRLVCVVLNSCYTAAHASAFRAVSRCAAGSVISLPDDTALAFARGFHHGIRAGVPPRRAFDQGVAEAGLAGNRTSGLYFADFGETGTGAGTPDGLH